MNERDAVSEHYTTHDLERRILAALAEAGVDLERLSVEDLAPVDAFHVRGRAATEELAALAELRPGEELLDVGCGLGGTSRFLASSAGCRVVGLDLTAEYCRVAERLSARVGLAERTSFRQGSALELPFDAGTFDVVWTEHVQMNVADKARFYGELARVLRPGGRLAFHDVFTGETPGLELPVPWATEASISHLIGVDEVRELLAGAGLAELHWVDRTEESTAFFGKVVERLGTHGWMPMGLHLLMGEQASEKFANMLRNLERDRLRVVQAVLSRQPVA